MAYKKVSTSNYEAAKLKIERLRRFKNSFAYTATITLDNYEKAVDEYNVAMTAKNNALDVVDELTTVMNEKWDVLEKLDAALRVFIGKDKGQDSDEYIAAGGTPMSEILAQQQRTREANKKANEGKDKPV